MTRIITCVSGKGGVGKTTFVANIGSALADAGRNVTILDANLTTPNLGLHLGIPLFPTTLHDVLKGRAHIHDAIYEQENGLKIIPSGISLRDLRGVDVGELPNRLLDLLGKTEIIMLDAAAGLGREALTAIEAADELIIITNPEISAVTDALKAAKLGEQLGTRVTGIVINRVSGSRHEMKTAEVMNMLDHYELLGEIPEDHRVAEATAKRTPVIYHYPDIYASQMFKKIAADLIGHRYEIKKQSIFTRLFRR
ncbi:MAG: P-loop NTPase [Candidatus Aenigmarchaeota archaeon]|nr:P-loop NTPase [Candidatus Aenigmarchaeota archaeon]